MLKKMKSWYTSTIHWARTGKALGMISFAESSFFPIPPDPVLLNIVLEKPKKWKHYALITLVTSVLGGMFGYFIGIALFESFGTWLIETYQLQEEFDHLGELFDNNGFISIFAAALTPIPYKIFTITAGAFKLNFALFIFASILGRGLRFSAVAFAGAYFGKKYSDKIGPYIDRISSIILISVVLLIAIYSLIV